MILGQFVDNFIEPNSILLIGKVHKVGDYHEFELLWKGMSWLCTYDEDNLKYIARRFPKELCPYVNYTDFKVASPVYGQDIEYDAICIILNSDSTLEFNLREETEKPGRILERNRQSKKEIYDFRGKDFKAIYYTDYSEDKAKAFLGDFFEKFYTEYDPEHEDDLRYAKSYIDLKGGARIATGNYIILDETSDVNPIILPEEAFKQEYLPRCINKN